MSPETKHKLIGALITAGVAALITFLAKFGELLGGINLSYLDLKTAIIAALASRVVV